MVLRPLWRTWIAPRPYVEDAVSQFPVCAEIRPIAEHDQRTAGESFDASGVNVSEHGNPHTAREQTLAHSTIDRFDLSFRGNDAVASTCRIGNTSRNESRETRMEDTERADGNWMVDYRANEIVPTRRLRQSVTMFHMNRETVCTQVKRSTLDDEPILPLKRGSHPPVMVPAEHRHGNPCVDKIRHRRKHSPTTRRNRSSVFEPEIEEIADYVECARTALDPPEERNEMLLLRRFSRCAQRLDVSVGDEIDSVIHGTHRTKEFCQSREKKCSARPLSGPRVCGKRRRR